MAEHPDSAPIFGVGAEFASPSALLSAVRDLSARDLGRIDTYSPIPVPGMEHALQLQTKWIRPFALLGVIAGFIGFMAMCAYATGYAYVLNIGGRPDIAWLSYVVPSFSFSLMLAALLVMGTMLVLNRLPRLNHPAFNLPEFTRASQDRFFLLVEARHDRFDPELIEQALRSLAIPPLATARVPR